METHSIGVIVDSTCDIPDELVQQYGIIVIPQLVVWGDEQLRDRVDLLPQDFYRRLLSDPVRPHSSLPSLQDFQAAYNQAIACGAQEIVVLTVSSAMSGTYQMAQTAASLVDIPVTVIDSKGPTMTLGWQTLAAARAREMGATLSEIVEETRRVRSRMVQLVAMNSIEYLQRGGRIGGAAKWVGTLLNVKPLVAINHQTGLVEPVSLARTHHALVETMYAKFFERLGDGGSLHIAVMHGNAPEQAAELAERIQTQFHPLELITNITGPVLGINTGPGALALCGYSDIPNNL